jgi:hypothetical protein
MSLLSQAIRRQLIDAAPKGQKGAVKKSISETEAKLRAMLPPDLTPEQRAALEKILAALIDALIKILASMVPK